MSISVSSKTWAGSVGRVRWTLIRSRAWLIVSGFEADGRVTEDVCAGTGGGIIGLASVGVGTTLIGAVVWTGAGTGAGVTKVASATFLPSFQR